MLNSNKLTQRIRHNEEYIQERWTHTWRSYEERCDLRKQDLCLECAWNCRGDIWCRTVCVWFERDRKRFKDHLPYQEKCCQCCGKVLWSNGIPVTHHYRVQDIPPRTLLGENWLRLASRRRIEKRVAEFGCWIARNEFIHTVKMLFSRSQ